MHFGLRNRETEFWLLINHEKMNETITNINQNQPQLILFELIGAALSWKVVQAVQSGGC